MPEKTFPIEENHAEADAELSERASDKRIVLIARREALLVLADIFDSRTERLNRKGKRRAKAFNRVMKEQRRHEKDRAPLEAAIAVVNRDLKNI